MADKMFWTDTAQASERITNTYVLYDGSPVYVERIRADGSAEVLEYPKRERRMIPLSDAGFKNFRILPPTGWVNYKYGKTAIYLQRRPRRSRQHGLTGDNVYTGYLNKTGTFSTGGYSYEEIVGDEGYILACKNDYPSLDDVLMHIREGSALAVSPQYAVFRDDAGVRWLFRGSDKVGIFSGTDTLMLLKKYLYLKEELSDSPTITISNFKEF